MNQKRRQKAIKMYSVAGAYENLLDGIPPSASANMGFDVSFKVENDVLHTDENGVVSIQTETVNYTMNVISTNEMIEFLGNHYDWKFLYKSDFDGKNDETENLQALSYLWDRFIEHNRDNFTRAIRDMYYDYNPIYNYDRNEVHYYNIKDAGGSNKSGSSDDTTTMKGSITESYSGENSDSGSTSESFTSKNYVNSETDNDSVPDRATDSNNQSSEIETGNTGSQSSTTETTYNGHGTTGNRTYSESDETSNDHTGQEGLKTVGNIGVTTSTAMVKEDVLFRMTTNVATMILDKFAKETLFLAGGDDDDC